MGGSQFREIQGFERDAQGFDRRRERVGARGGAQAGRQAALVLTLDFGLDAAPGKIQPDGRGE